MKVAMSYQLSALSKSPVWQSVGCALRTTPFFRNRHERRFHILMVRSERRA